MKTLKLFFLSIFFIFCLLNSSLLPAQSPQMKKWWIHNYHIKTTNQSIVSDVKVGTSLNGPSNSIYDKNQQLIFYVNNKEVRAANGSLLVTLNTGFHNHEYTIVPFIGMEACNEE